MCKYFSSAGRILSMFAFTMFSALLLLGCDSSSTLSDIGEVNAISVPETREGKTGNAMAPGWSTPQRVRDINVGAAPEVEVFNGKLHIVYRGQSSNRIGHLTMNASHVFSTPVVLSDETSGQPALTINSSGDRMYLAFRGTSGIQAPTYPDGHADYYYRIGLKSIGLTGSWSSTTVLNANGYDLRTAHSPEIVPNGSGGVYVYFYDGVENWAVANVAQNGNVTSVDDAGFQATEVSVYDYIGRRGIDFPRVGGSKELYIGQVGNWEQITGVTAKNGPTVAVSYANGVPRTHLAYRGDNVGVGYISPDRSFTGSIGTQTGATPAIAIFNNRVYIFFKNDNNNELFYTYKNL